ncbi:MAG: hypothetical protein ACP5M0_03135 [Desulfomonilaceae bacterium]
MIQVTALWNKLVEKVRGATRPSRLEEKRTKRSLVVTPPTFPETPQPKARPKDRYTVLVLPESGDAKQVALSKSRLKILAALSAGALVFLVIVAFGMVKYFSRQHLAAVSSVTAASQPPAPAEQAGTRPIQTPAPPTNKTDSLGAQTPAPPQDAAQPRAEALREESAGSAQTGDQKAAQPVAKEQPSQAISGDATAAASQPGAEPFVINFDAQQVTATVETPNNGTLSFRLVKDQPDIKFAGYLFVYVEMEDKRGENRIYVYPKQTRLGEGDLPYDFRDGEMIAFKFNSRVELPYGDPRPSASLSAVSILLYGENGKIVFQRTFGRQEVAMVSSKSNKAEQPKPRSSEKRQAL